MKTRILFVTTVAAILLSQPLSLSPAFSATQGLSPWIGTWRLNPSKSTPTSNSPYKRVTLKIEPWEDGLKVVYDMVGIRGGVNHVEWTGRFDGKDYPVQGVDELMTNAYNRINDHTYSIVIKRDGQTFTTVKVSVSSDGRSLTAITTGKNAQGQDTSTTAVYDRL
jgi:hypothetical protein